MHRHEDEGGGGGARPGHRGSSFSRLSPLILLSLLLPPSLNLPPQLEMQEVVRGYEGSKRRLIVLGYNATLTTL